MKHILLLLIIFLPVILYAQGNPINQKPPAGKGRVFFIFYMYRQIPQRVMLNRLPVFLNDSLICRLPNKTYSFHDVDPGTYSISADLGGKKPGPKTERKDIEIADGEILYFEMVGVAKVFRQSVLLINLMEREAKDLLMKLPPLQDCGVRKPESGSAFANKKYFAAIQTGYAFAQGNYKNWWPSQSQALVTNFTPFAIGFEAGLRLGTANHFLSFAFTNNTQAAIKNNALNLREWISINNTAIFYSYAFQLDRQNRFLLYPKIGFGTINYVLEQRVDMGVRRAQAVVKLATTYVLQTEYRISRTFSIHINGEYLNGKVAFDNRNIRLNQYRLLTGVKAQF